jgi:nitrogen-specific signal transduction histidine kinase
MNMSIPVRILAARYWYHSKLFLSFAMRMQHTGLLRVAEHQEKGALWQRFRDMEQALATARSEAAVTQHLLAQSLNEATDAMLLVDNTQRVRVLNEQLYVLFGLNQPPAHWVGRPAALVESQLREQLAEPAAFDRLLASPTAGFVALHLHGLRMVEVKVQRLPSTAGGGYLLCGRDMTSQRNFFQQLQTLASIPTHHTTPVLRFSFAGEQVYANLAAEQLLASLGYQAPVVQAELRALLATAHSSNSTIQGKIVAGSAQGMQAVVVPFQAMGYAEVHLVPGSSSTPATHTLLPNASLAARTPAGLPTMVDYLAPLGTAGSLAPSLTYAPITTLNGINSVRNKLAPFDFCQVIGEALAPLAWQAQQQGLDFGFTPTDLPAHYPQVLGDTASLSQVLVNLVSNALKFTGQGHVHVRSQVQAQTDTTVTLQVEVADSGIGMADDKQALLFDAFAQAHKDFQRHSSTGRDLQSTRQLVQQLGGTLSVASQPGAGSTFTLLLTLLKAVPTLTSPRPAEPAAWSAYACCSTATRPSTTTWPITYSSTVRSSARA